MKKWGHCWHLRASACINVWTVSAHWQRFLRQSRNSSMKKHRTLTELAFSYNRFLLGHNRFNSGTTAHEGEMQEGWRMSESLSFWGMTFAATKSRVKVLFCPSMRTRRQRDKASDSGADGNIKVPVFSCKGPCTACLHKTATAFLCLKKNKLIWCVT